MSLNLQTLIYINRWNMYISLDSPKKLNQQDIERERLVSVNWLMQLWELTSLKSEGEADRLKTQARADAEVLS